MTQNIYGCFFFCLVVLIPFSSSGRQYNNITSESQPTLTVKTSQGIVVLEAISDQIIRVRVQKNLPLNPKPELAIIQQ